MTTLSELNCRLHQPRPRPPPDERHLLQGRLDRRLRPLRREGRLHPRRRNHCNRPQSQMIFKPVLRMFYPFFQRNETRMMTRTSTSFGAKNFTFSGPGLSRKPFTVVSIPYKVKQKCGKLSLFLLSEGPSVSLCSKMSGAPYI